MAAMNFPSSPSNGDTYTNPDTGVIYTYDGTDAKWKTTVTSNAFLPLSGGTLTGALNVADIKHPSSGSNNVVLASDGSATIATLNSTTITGTTIQGVIKSGTAVASTSGTAIDFTSIPSWVKRITVMFDGVSLSGSSSMLIQLGSGSVTTSGYTSTSIVTNNLNGTGGITSTAGFLMYMTVASFAAMGHMIITKITGNTWISSHSCRMGPDHICGGGGTIALSGTLDRVRITTINGTDTFDAGTINILYEG